MIPQQNISILCVDDDPGNLRFLERVLAANGYPPMTAANGFKGLAVMNRNRHQVQLVILDLRMSGVDGFAFIERARIAGYAGKFIVLSGAISPSDRAWLHDLGITVILQKPAPLSTLLNAVRAAQIG